MLECFECDEIRADPNMFFDNLFRTYLKTGGSPQTFDEEFEEDINLYQVGEYGAYYIGLFRVKERMYEKSNNRRHVELNRMVENEQFLFLKRVNADTEGNLVYVRKTMVGCRSYEYIGLVRKDSMEDGERAYEELSDKYDKFILYN